MCTSHRKFTHAAVSIDDQPWTDADKFENVNLVTTTDANTVAALSKQLHAAFGYPDPE